MTDNESRAISAEDGPAMFSELTSGSEDQNTALKVARKLAKAGIPIFVAKRDMTTGEWNPTGGHKNSGYWLPKGWSTLDAVSGQTGRLRAYRPGDALCAVMGWGLDVIDIDPRNGGHESVGSLPGDISVVGVANTPNLGAHWFIRSLNVASRDNVLPGIDVKAGTELGRGRGFAWIAPTVRLSKVTGELTAYTWNRDRVPDLDQLTERYQPSDALRVLVESNRAPVSSWEGPPATDDDVLTRVHQHAERIVNAPEGEGNSILNEVAFKVGEYVGAGQVGMDTAYEILNEALDSWEFAAGDESAQRACLVRALEQGAGKPRAWTAAASTGGLEEWTPGPIPAAQKGMGWQDPATVKVASDLFKAALYGTPETVTGDLFEELGSGGDDQDDDDPAPAAAEIGVDEPEVDDDSWQSIDLSGLDDEEEEPPVFMPRSDGVICLLYRGLIHSIHGESESGKSWIAQAEAVRLIKLGEHVLFLDFENDAKKVRFRFLALGATKEELKLIDYRNPDAKPQYGGKWWQHMFSGKFALIVLDGVTDALGIFSMGTKDNDEISTFLRKFPRALARRTNAAVVLIDHVVKDKDSRGRWALGGQAKMAGLDGAAYVVETKEQMGRGKIGVLDVWVGKDKSGFVRGVAGDMDKNRLAPIARFVLDSSDREDGSVVRARLDPPGGDPFGETDEFDPGLELKILGALSDAGGTLPSQQKIVVALGDAPGARREDVLSTIKALAERGDLTIGEPDGRKARVHTITERGQSRADGLS